jgi:hypothetical protein
MTGGYGPYDAGMKHTTRWVIRDLKRRLEGLTLDEMACYVSYVQMLVKEGLI